MRLASALCGLFASLLPGCAKHRFLRENAIGIWDAASSSLDLLARAPRPGRPRLHLSADGTFEGQNVPYELAESVVSKKGLASAAKGTWSVDDDGQGRTVVNLLFREVDGEPTSYLTGLYVGCWRGHCKAWFYLGDPDSGRRFVFERLR